MIDPKRYTCGKTRDKCRPLMRCKTLAARIIAISRIAAVVLVANLSACVSYQPKVTVDTVNAPVIWLVSFVENGLPAVDVQIGNAIYKMAIDLGLCRQIMSIKPNLLSRISSRRTGHFTIATDAMKGKLDKLEHQLINDVRIGDLVLHNVEVMPETRSAVPEAVDGLIGLGLLGRFTILIDYKSERIALYVAEYEPPDAGSWHKVKVRATINEGFITDVRMGARSYKMLLDTGSWNKQNSNAIFVRKQNLLELNQDSELFIDNASIGKYHLEPLFEMPTPFDGVLGWAFFSKYKAVLKLNRQLLYYIEA
jgi:hypothetical protein